MADKSHEQIGVLSCCLDRVGHRLMQGQDIFRDIVGQISIFGVSPKQFNRVQIRGISG